MLLSIGLILLGGIIIRVGLQRARIPIPALVGYVILGMILGPYGGKLLSSDFLDQSSILRQIALVIILLRAGLALDLKDLKTVGRPAVLLCFLPATMEIIGVTIFSTLLLKLSVTESILLGTVLAAVSPAVVVPRMLRLMEQEKNGKGLDYKKIPQMVIAGASADDIFVMVLFSVFLGMETRGVFSYGALFEIPVSIVGGIIIGYGFGVGLGNLTGWIGGLDNHKKTGADKVLESLLALIGLAVLLIFGESFLKENGVMSYSGLLAVMALGIGVLRKNPTLARAMSRKLASLWLGAEIVLFVLVGVAVQITYAFSGGIGLLAVLIIVGGLVFRMGGTWLTMLGTGLSKKEKGFVMVAYSPKATVQAAIGGIPLAMGLACGEVIITTTVLAILITAPLGAIGIDYLSKIIFQK